MDSASNHRCKKIMIQATGFGTGVGKSFLVALLCKLFSQDGHKVAPYKTLNLTTVTYVKDGKEFGYAQALQARAAGIEPDYRMNPLTPKPLGNGRFDIFLKGECVEKDYDPRRDFIKMTFKQLVGLQGEYKRIEDVAKECLGSLSREYDIICIEGSGPTKLLGLGAFSRLLGVANIETARIADAPVLLITPNVDSVPQTLSYLAKEEQKRIKGVIVNECPINALAAMGIGEGIINLGLKRIGQVYGQKIGVEILGILPYFEELSKLPDLDPLVPSPKVPFDVWDEMISDIAEKARKYIELDKIYRIME